MNQIVNFKSSLPSAIDTKSLVESLATGLQGAVRSGDTLLKMAKDGTWSFGRDGTEVQAGSKWAVNPASFTHGFVAWGDGELIDEKMAPISRPLPETGPVPAGARAWDMQLGISLKCVFGDDAGLEVVFRTTSIGGKNALKTLGNKIIAQAQSNPAKLVPVVTLDTEHYVHRQYGKIYTPALTVADWISMDGPETPEEEPAPAVEAPKPTTRLRRPAAV